MYNWIVNNILASLKTKDLRAKRSHKLKVNVFSFTFLSYVRSFSCNEPIQCITQKGHWDVKASRFHLKSVDASEDSELDF